MIAEKVANLSHGVRSDVSGETSVTRERAAEQTGTTPQSISQVRAIKAWAPTAAKKVENGEITLETVWRLVGVPTSNRGSRRLTELIRLHSSSPLMSDGDI
jgi:hypothetical protein